MRTLVLAAVLLAPVGTPAHERAGLVDLQRLAPTLQLDLRYAHEAQPHRREAARVLPSRGR